MVSIIVLFLVCLIFRKKISNLLFKFFLIKDRKLLRKGKLIHVVKTTKTTFLYHTDNERVIIEAKQPRFSRMKTGTYLAILRDDFTIAKAKIIY